jgi:multidrug resistance efflux pump
LVQKFLVSTISIALLVIVFGKMEYRVEAVVNLQTDNIAYISAPFDGIVENVYKQSGDFINKDETIAKFDIQELSLKELEVNSEIVKYSAEIEKARASMSLADMKISQAKKNQSTASLKKIEYYLSQAKLKSPFKGIIVDGDKEKVMGSPFSKGDIIFQIANPVGLYANIKVLEEYIDEIKVGQITKINLISRPDEYFKVQIEKIVPLANVDDKNGNVFTIKAKFLDDTKEWMRPGMSGVAKVSIEDRTIFWILTHKISDYLHLNIWW